MTILAVMESNGVLVIDYRLIGAELGIQPKNVLANVDKHLTTPDSEAVFGRVAFETETLETKGGKQNTRVAYLNQPQAEFLMTLSRNTPQVIAAKRNLVHAFEKAKQLIKENISPQSQELELKKLELQLIQAKHRYLETSHAIQLSTSPATLAWLRGETPPPPKIEYRERFVDPRTGKELGSAEGRSLTQLISDAGLNPKSTKDRQKVKRILKNCGFDYDKQHRWSNASYLHNYPVLDEEAYEQVLKAVLAEVVAGEMQPNLFVTQMQQTSLGAEASRPSLTTAKHQDRILTP